jgi:glycosyltransferase involved in cell wall biosynthesis
VSAPAFSARRPLVVITTMTRWDETPRIRHQVARQLARYCNVLYVELPFTPGGQGPEWSAADDGALLVFRPRAQHATLRRLRNHLGLVRRWHDARMLHDIEAAVRALGHESAALVNFQFDFDAVMRSPLFARKVYLCNDEFQEGARFWVRSLNLAAEREIASRADLSLAVSFPLLEKLQRFTPRAQLFLPGHESAIEAEAAVRARVPPIEVCCMGFLNSRLVVDWLRALSEDARFRLTLIGPIENPEAWADLTSRPGVRHTGTLVGAELERQLRTADVFVMPYDVKQAPVRAITAPNKLFQYLASGKPVVCSNLPRLIDLPHGFLYVAANREDFVAAVARAFEEDTLALARARLDYAAQNSWTARGEKLRDMLSTPGLAHVRT